MIACSFRLGGVVMQMLYLDESGTVADPNQKHFILAGFSVFERKSHWIEQKLNNIAKRFDPANPNNFELHGSPMRSGREEWRGVPLTDRLTAISDSLKEAIADENGQIRLFGVVIRKAALVGKDPVEYAFEILSQRFDLFLQREYIKFQNPQRGIILFDKSNTERRIQTLARDFKYNGHTWGLTRNYAEVPVFLDSKASRLIQLADLVAFSMYRHYEHSDSSFFSIIQNCFDREGGVVQGLHEVL